MFDQSFSVRNFKKIYDVDRKNKGAIEKDHFPKAYMYRLKIYALKKVMKFLVIRHNQKKISSIFFELKQNKLNNHIDKRKEQLKNEINSKLENIVENVSIKGYTLPLVKSAVLKRGKAVYSIGHDVETIFVSRQVQNILRSVYNVKINNRDLIISRLSSIVKDLSPKYIVRADVESFYESISHKNLLNILHSSPKLSVTPRRVLTQLIRSYADISGANSGLPRGVGISAYLSEVYMGDIDLEVSSLKDIIYYERYVDDLIIVFSPSKDENKKAYLTKITDIINRRQLNLNEKTKELDLVEEKNGNFDYLGYCFIFEMGHAKIKLSKSKVTRIKDRIDKSFSQYLKVYHLTPKKSYELLLTRIRFLTGNTRLYNSKSKAFVGVYFSNKYITDTADLNGLDRYLKYKASLISDNKLKRRIDKLSFKNGFENRVFRKFTIEVLSNISKAWKND